MQLLDQVDEGFQTLDAGKSTKDKALHYLNLWLTQPEFSLYRPQIEWLVQQRQWASLLDRFYQILPFGTGGRRGPVGIGPNRMNWWTLGASVQGHCEFLKERFPGQGPLRVVLAYDVRRFEDKRGQYHPALPNPVLHLSSKDLAHHAAGVYAANGVDIHLLPPESNRYLATPELSFVIRYLHCHGGLNISASHNPPDDNGGKFYDERGGQPVPPDDQIMADLVDQVKGVKCISLGEAVRGGHVHWLDSLPHRSYIDLCRKQSLVPPPRGEIKVVFTPLHGVGSMTAMETLVSHGFLVIPVEEQMTPDGQFPNVTRIPNPEVPESMDRAEASARRSHADLVLATDPDADRIGGMIPSETEDWRFLNGHEMAALLTHFKLSQWSQQGLMPPSALVIKTEVTTNLVTRIARHFRVQIVDNLLVGFKYIAEVLRQLEETGAYEDIRGTPEDLVIACEESHGILVTPHIRDKDASGAALLMAELTLEQRRRHCTVLQYLENLYCQFGYFAHVGFPVVMSGIEGKKMVTQMLASLRAEPPQKIADLMMTDFEDLQDENGRLGPIKGATDAASRNVLLFRLGEYARIALRPSGTEPKAKAYIEVSSPPCPAGMLVQVWKESWRAVDEMAQRLASEFMKLIIQRQS